MDGELMRKMAVVIGQETRAGFNLKTWLDNGKNGAGLECWYAPSRPIVAGTAPRRDWPICILEGGDGGGA